MLQSAMAARASSVARRLMAGANLARDRSAPPRPRRAAAPTPRGVRTECATPRRRPGAGGPADRSTHSTERMASFLARSFSTSAPAGFSPSWSVQEAAAAPSKMVFCTSSTLMPASRTAASTSASTPTLSRWRTTSRALAGDFLATLTQLGMAAAAGEAAEDAHRLVGDGVLRLVGRGADVVGAVDAGQLAELAVEGRLPLLRLADEDVGADADLAGLGQLEERRLVHHLGPRGVDEEGPGPAAPPAPGGSRPRGSPA